MSINTINYHHVFVDYVVSSVAIMSCYVCVWTVYRGKKVYPHEVSKQQAKLQQIDISMAIGPSTMIKGMHIPCSRWRSLHRGTFCLRWDRIFRVNGKRGNTKLGQQRGIKICPKKCKKKRPLSLDNKDEVWLIRG